MFTQAAHLNDWMIDNKKYSDLPAEYKHLGDKIIDLEELTVGTVPSVFTLLTWEGPYLRGIVYSGYQNRAYVYYPDLSDWIEDKVVLDDAQRYAYPGIDEAVRNNCPALSYLGVLDVMRKN